MSPLLRSPSPTCGNSSRPPTTPAAEVLGCTRPRHSDAARDRAAGPAQLGALAANAIRPPLRR
ncbi:hypothetical protein [Actinomadura montaniterrae]|uniref:Uncharacterized protein n=1 Tax=Actinomadura montaniterrae TaxID=1803903 RepID=A0A6L3VY91_9ACTN|nr:hypothetical protein [Actinomadura montaniterrae]KAB2376957.1 hypothetical protein F9B16_24275 [Actinomadura montaniterrae]